MNEYHRKINNKIVLVLLKALYIMLTHSLFSSYNITIDFAKIKETPDVTIIFPNW